MRGMYNIYSDGKKISHGNVITNAGRLGILNTLAGKRNGFAESICVGIGNTAATINDEALVFQVSGADMTTSIIDPINEKIYFKAVLPINDQYVVYEIGCFPNNFLASQSIDTTSSSLLINFSNLTRWEDVDGEYTLESTNNRFDINSIQYDIVATETAKGYALVDLDLSYLPEETKFSFAYYSSELSDFIVRFKTDDSNYFSYNGLTVSNGYQIASFLKSDFTLTGSPLWSDINYVEIEAIAGASPGVISLDALRYDVLSGENNELLSRAVLATPVSKLAGITMDIEYVLDLDV